MCNNNSTRLQVRNFVHVIRVSSPEADLAVSFRGAAPLFEVMAMPSV